VSYSPAFKWFVGLLLPLTFAWKLAAGPGDPNETSAALAQFLIQHDFQNVKTEEMMDGMWAIRAHKGECRLFVVEAGAGKGWTRDLIGVFTDPSDQLFIVSHGSVYDYDSTWLTDTHDTYFAVLRKIGLARPAPVLGVAASPTCAGKRLPWNEL
jgi:hypothetical protein